MYSQVLYLKPVPVLVGGGGVAGGVEHLHQVQDTQQARVLVAVAHTLVVHLNIEQCM